MLPRGRVRWTVLVWWVVAGVVCVEAWERGVARRDLPRVEVLDLNYVPPLAGLTTTEFVDALRNTGGFLANRGFLVPASADVASYGTLQFDVGVHSGRPEAQADACLAICGVYNALAQTSVARDLGMRCGGITVAVTQSRSRFYVDVGYSANHLRRGSAMCSTPTPRYASCFLLRRSDALDVPFVPVLLTTTTFELAHSDCLLSALLEGEGSCSLPAQRAPWRRLYSADGAVLQSDALAAQGPACACPPNVVGAQCTLAVDSECLSPPTAPLLTAHCAAASSSVRVDDTTFTSRVCDEALGQVQCSVCADPSRYGPLCALDWCTRLDGSPVCGPEALACDRGFCRCPPGWDATTGCRQCAHGFQQVDGACVALSECWTSWDPQTAEPGWYAPGGHGGRGQLCNGHGMCVAGTPSVCVCDELWGGAGCSVDLRGCASLGTVQAGRTNAVGACTLGALDAAQVQGQACPEEDAAFTVVNVLAEQHGWQVCALLNAVLDVFNAADAGQQSHCAGVAPPVNGTRTLAESMVPGPGCDWTASVQHVFGSGVSLGLPVRCRGRPCAPPVVVDAEWAELVPVEGVPTLFTAQAACRGVQTRASERARVAGAVDIDEVQRRQLRGLPDGLTGLQQSVLWYIEELSGQLAWRSHLFQWVGDDMGVVGAWQEFEVQTVGRPASQYQQPGATLPYHSVVCVVEATFQPGQDRGPVTAASRGGASMLLHIQP